MKNTIDISMIKFDENGLVPAIVQDENGQVLMLAYMNEESLNKTLETGYTWFYSRSRQKLWQKGETSGNTQKVSEIDYDCEEKLMASDLFMIYSKWAKQNNEWEMSSKRFNMEVSKKIPDKGRNSKGIYYLKVKLTEYGQTLLGRQYKIDDFTKAGVK